MAISADNISNKYANDVWEIWTDKNFDKFSISIRLSRETETHHNQAIVWGGNNETRCSLVVWTWQCWIVLVLWRIVEMTLVVLIANFIDKYVNIELVQLSWGNELDKKLVELVDSIN